MGKVIVTEKYIKDIAMAIREKNKTTNTYKISDMGNEIRNIKTGYPTTSLDTFTFIEGIGGCGMTIFTEASNYE